MDQNPMWRNWHTAGMLIVLAALIALGFLIPARQVLLLWLLILALLVVFTNIAGHGITGRFWLGWLVNEQYRMSLSRLQMFLWTLVILSGFLTAALMNLRRGDFDTAVSIALPEEVWIAMGVSTTSLVASPLILQGKKGKKTNTAELKRSLGLAAGAELTSEDEATAVGQLDRNRGPDQARLYDLLRGEEIGNRKVMDLTRLQNLFFTLILIGSYAGAVGSKLAEVTGSLTPQSFAQFPELGASNLALLSISHAGYLAAKAIDKQPEDER